MFNPTVYYAHCMAIYGTVQEDRDVLTLEQLGFDVVNPNTRATDKQCRLVKEARGSKAVMDEIFQPMVKGCSALAFRALPDGSIPAGVAKEIEWAIELGLPVFELPSGIVRRTLDVDVTREYLREIGQR